VPFAANQIDLVTTFADQAVMFRERTVVGVIFVGKGVPEPFAANQIDLVTTFADQAVILEAVVSAAQRTPPYPNLGQHHGSRGRRWRSTRLVWKAPSSAWR
jgi:hypothetical protein